MDNAILMSFTEIPAAIGARLVSFSPKGRGGFSSVSIDSRTTAPGALFVALIGTVQDGHRFVEAAFKAGAAGAMVTRSGMEDPALGLAETAKKMGTELLVVEDTLRGLQDTARVYLEKFPALLKIGITGSSGKTTTKEIAAAMISREKSVVMNAGNLNSETGLPLSIFNVRQEHEIGIFEMGMNRKGEIAELAGVLKPHIALVTNIGSSHIGIIGSKEGISREKKAIFSQFQGNGMALIPQDDEYRDFLAEGVRGEVHYYGPGTFKELIGYRELGLEGSEINWGGIRTRFGLPGRHNFKNALAAAAIALEVPVSSDAIRAGLESVKPLFGRSEIISGPVTVIRDCYNANPESTREVITLCDGLEWPGRRVYVIGSMLELGEESPEAHAELGRTLAFSKADMVFLFGTETKAVGEVLKTIAAGRQRWESSEGQSRCGGDLENNGCRMGTELYWEGGAVKGGQRGQSFAGNRGGRKIPFFYTDTMKELSRLLVDYVRPGDLVLLKGSRGCALERLTGVLTSAPVFSGTELGLELGLDEASAVKTPEPDTAAVKGGV